MNDVLSEVIRRLQFGPTTEAHTPPVRLAPAEISRRAEPGDGGNPIHGTEQQTVAAIQRRLNADESAAGLMNNLGGSIDTFSRDAPRVDGSRVRLAEPEPSLGVDHVATHGAQGIGSMIGNEPTQNVMTSVSQHGEAFASPGATRSDVDRGWEENQTQLERSKRHVGAAGSPFPDVEGIAERLKDQLQPMFEELNGQLLRTIRSEGNSRQFRLRANEVE